MGTQIKVGGVKVCPGASKCGLQCAQCFRHNFAPDAISGNYS